MKVVGEVGREPIYTQSQAQQIIPCQGLISLTRLGGVEALAKPFTDPRGWMWDGVGEVHDAVLLESVMSLLWLVWVLWVLWHMTEFDT